MVSPTEVNTPGQSWGLLAGAGMQAPYQYMQQLQQIKRCRPHPTRQLPSHLAAVTTPLHLSAWKKAFKVHPDKDFSHHNIQGITSGFHIGFEYGKVTCQAASTNLSSTSQHPAVVEEYISKELGEGRIAEVHDPAGLTDLQISPFGVIPKKEPGRWRLIVDLSFPEGASVNDSIDKSICSLQYVTVDHIAAVVYALGTERTPQW